MARPRLGPDSLGPSMKRSSTVVLVLSGALLAGCSQEEAEDSAILDTTDTNTYTNNTYRPSFGYYHAPHYAWYPRPYGDFVPGLGYYYGGQYRSNPEPTPSLAASSPAKAPATRVAAHASTSTARGGFGRSWFSGGS